MRRLFFLAALAAASTAGSTSRALAAPAPIKECTDAIGTPTNAEVSAACSGKGNCPVRANYYTWVTGDCDVTVTYTSGPAQQWVRIAAFNASDGECNHASHPVDPNCTETKDKKTYTQKHSDTYSSSWENTWNWGVDLKAGINWKIIELSGGGHYQNEYSTGAQNSSTKESTTGTELIANAGCCGLTERWNLVWKRDYTATANVVHTISIACKNNFVQCHYTTLKTGTKTVNLKGTRFYERQESCDIACTASALNKCCTNGSSTSGTREQCNALIDVCNNCP